MSKNKNVDVLRPAAEDTYREELEVLRKEDKRQRPANWQMSPWAVVQYIMGGKLDNGFVIEPKYYGNKRLIEIAVATLATDRSLLLMGIPGTGKTWVAEHLTAAISGTSKLLVQGTAGMNEDLLRYSWNYAKLLAEGPSESAIIRSPVMYAMQEGKIARVEELTRIPADVQDTLITILSEKVLPIPEINSEVMANKGFNIIATANNRDKGVNELSSALRRRFNTVVLPLPETLAQEVQIVEARAHKIGRALDIPETKSPIKEIQRLVTIFRELRNGETIDGKSKLKVPGSTLSPAEAISVITNGSVLATHFGNGEIGAADIAASLTGAVVKDPVQDKLVWQEYLETVVRRRKDWKDLYKECMELL